MFNYISFQTNQVLLIISVLFASIPAIVFVAKKYKRFGRNQAEFNTNNFLIGIIASLTVIFTLLNWEIHPTMKEYTMSEGLADDTIKIVRTAFPEKKKALPKLLSKATIKKEIFEIELTDAIEEKVADLKDASITEEDKPVYVGNEITEEAAEVKIEKADEGGFLVIAEQMPRFPGCEQLSEDKEEIEKCAKEKLLDYLYSKLRYPRIAVENGISGTVVIQFVVTSEGTINNIRIAKDIGGGCGEAAASVVSSMNELQERWTPGKQRGRPVSVQFTLPVKFKTL